MNKEQLLEAGLSEEQADNILKLHKEAIDGKFVAKHRFDEVNGELKTIKEQVTERDEQINDLKKFEGDTKELQEKIATLENENASKNSEYQAKLSKERKQNAVRLALLENEEAKPYDTNMVMSLFDLEKVMIDEQTGKITGGFDEQSESIYKDKAFLFSTKETDGGGKGNHKPGWKPAGDPPADGDKSNEGADSSVSYGKSLAQIKLGMMGVKPAGTN